MLSFKKQNASYAAVLVDCARHSLYVRTCTIYIKYWLKILNMQDDRFVKKCYIMQCMLLKDDSNGKVNWSTSVRKCLFSSGLGYIWEKQGVDNPNCFIRFFTSLLHEINTQD